ncbi:origin recognition complex subunit 4 C-terminus-domain-containing protein [Phyllosticta citrichinensis]|uniref:Origin recognition complex subunit 4 n=1 Tax=Phyllosticta citrichinensis TaxID=1130410 RepID=A0ABR1Y4M4_9PEZI
MVNSRYSKRRKLSPPEEDPAATTNGASPTTSTPGTGKLKRPTKRSGLLSREEEKENGTASASTPRRRSGRHLNDPDIYDDIDGAFGESPTQQLLSEAKSSASKKTPTYTRARTRTTRANTKGSHGTPNGDILGEDIERKDQETPSKTRSGPQNGEPGNSEAGADNLDKQLEEAPSGGRRSAQRSSVRKSAKETPSSKSQKTPSKGDTSVRSTRSTKEEPHTNGISLGSSDELDGPLTSPKATPKKQTPRVKPSPSRTTSTRRSSTRKGSPLLGLVEDSDNEVSTATPRANRVSTTPKRKSSVKKTPARDSGKLPSLEDLTALKCLVLDRISGRNPIPLVGLEEEYKKVYSLVEQTINSGEGNSMLVIGARGSGKTALVNKVLGEISKEQRQDFYVIRLSGFVHTDDKLALREIWRQLGKDMDVEDDSMGKNYADTLATLLALLSHPSELAGEESNEIAKAVVFVMDEFDLFASHPRQTLLYNLFDIAQSRKAPIAVLGLTTRIGVSENLEKRVKSRFSHRYVHLSLAKSFTSFQEICKAALTVDVEELDGSDSAISGRWNKSIETLFSTPDFLTSQLLPHYQLNKSVPSALSAFYLPTASLTPTTFPLRPSHFASSASLTNTLLLHAPDSKLALLPSLSELQLALLIAAARLDVIHDTDTCNFNMAYAEYAALASSAKVASAAGGALASGIKVWGREVARAEWERLVQWELLLPVVANVVGGGGAAARGGGVGDTAMVRCDVAMEEIAPSVPGIERVMERWCRQI